MVDLKTMMTQVLRVHPPLFELSDIGVFLYRGNL